MHHNRQQFGIVCLVVHREAAIESINHEREGRELRDRLCGRWTDRHHPWTGERKKVGMHKKGQEKVEMSPNRPFNCTNVWAQIVSGLVEMSRHKKKLQESVEI